MLKNSFANQYRGITWKKIETPVDIKHCNLQSCCDIDLKNAGGFIKATDLWVWHIFFFSFLFQIHHNKDV